MKLAEIIEVQTTTIGNIERGETDTSVYIIFKIAHFANLPKGYKTLYLFLDSLPVNFFDNFKAFED